MYSVKFVLCKVISRSSSFLLSLRTRRAYAYCRNEKKVVLKYPARLSFLFNKRETLVRKKFAVTTVSKNVSTYSYSYKYFSRYLSFLGCSKSSSSSQWRKMSTVSRSLVLVHCVEHSFMSHHGLRCLLIDQL